MSARRAPARKPKSVERTTVLSAVDVELKDLAKLDKSLAAGSRAEIARAMARQLDNPEVSATAKSMCAKVLHETLDRLQELAPAKGASGVDEIKQRREKRLARSAGAQAQRGS